MSDDQQRPRIDGPWPLAGEIISKHGPWAIMVGMFGYVIYVLAIWAAPRADKVLEKHTTFMEQSAETSDKLADAVKSIDNTLTQLREDHDNSQGVGDETNVMVKENQKTLKEVHRAVVPKKKSSDEDDTDSSTP